MSIPSSSRLRRGTRVLLKKKFPDHMSYFDGQGKEAIVMYSYKDMYGGGKMESGEYSLLIDLDTKRPASSAWYSNDNIESIVSDWTTEENQLLLEKYGQR